MIYSNLSDLHLSFIVPRRGKGSSEVIGSITLFSNSFDQPENFIEFFTDYQKKVLNKDTVLDIGEEMVRKLNLKDLVLDISFSLPVDRLSPNLNAAICFILDCAYRYIYENNKSEVFMTIKCPIRVDYISVIKGEIKLSVLIPQKNFYFEDLLDLIQKYGDTVIYPISNISDKKLLQKKIDKGKTVDEYLKSIKSSIKNNLINKDISEKGNISVSFFDVYNMYKIQKGVIW